MVSTHEDRVYIIKDNPNDDAIKFGKALNARLKSAIGGFDNSCLTHNDYFESDDIYKERKKATSNKDLIGRLLQKEEMVFSSKGGSSIYDGLTDIQIKELNSYLDSIRLDMNLRKWVKEFANKAYEIDPMGLVFIEKDELGNPYPTYKAIGTVYDYQSNGQKLDYVCFELDDDEAEDMLIIPDDENGKEQTEFTFYRFVDDVADYIYKKDKKGNVSLVDKDIKGNQLTKLHSFKNTPAIVVSDIPYFEDTQKFVSKLDKVVELSEMYLNDRSIRDLSKKYHGFPKLVQPIVKCKKC